MKSNLLKVILLSMVLMGSLVITSCGQKPAATPNQDNGQANPSANAPANSQGMGAGNTPDLYGEVKKITNSDIEIALLESAQRRQITDEERQQMQERRNNSQNQNRQGNVQNPNGQDNSQNQNNQPANGDRARTPVERTYTGKTETISVAADAPITTFERGNGGPPQEKQLKLSDIKAGAVIQVWYKADMKDKKVIDRIRIMQDGN